MQKKHNKSVLEFNKERKNIKRKIFHNSDRSLNCTLEKNLLKHLKIFLKIPDTFLIGFKMCYKLEKSVSFFAFYLFIY